MTGLVDMVAALVPLRMMELAGLGHGRLRLHLAEMVCTCKHQCRGAATILGTHGDDLQYGGRHRSDARRALVDGLAVAALCAPGGVWWSGRHWCADHTVCQAAEQQAQEDPTLRVVDVSLPGPAGA